MFFKLHDNTKIQRGKSAIPSIPLAVPMSVK